jgi:hypothetical protein
MTPEQFKRLAQQNIFPGESGGDYNALFNYQNRPSGMFSDANLTGMTVDQALEFSSPSGPYGQYVKGQVGRVATPMGAYQVVGTTLRDAKAGLGLTGSEMMDAATQDRIGQYIFDTQGPGAWAGYTSNNGGQEIADQTMAAIGRRPINSDVQPRGILSSKGDQMDQQQPQGLLSALGIQRRDPTAQGETAQPFYNRQAFGDTLARIAPALGRMGVMGLEVPAQAALDERNARQSDQRAMAKAEQQRNATAEFVRMQGADDLADGIASGAITGAQALSALQQRLQGADPVSGINVGGNLVNPRTGELMYLSPEKPAVPLTQIGKLQFELASGQITQDQYDLGLANMAPSGMRIVSDGRGGFTMEQGSAVGGSGAMTEGQSKDAVFATRAEGALATLDPIADILTNLGMGVAGADPTGLIRGSVQSPEYQRAAQAGQEFLQAILRKDTGAAITPAEEALYGQTYLPRPGDGPDVLVQKQASRQRALAAIKAGMSPTALLAQEKALASGTTPPPPPAAGASEVDPALLEFMSPEDRALFQ